MTNEERQIIKLIKAYGYKINTDNMGMYFTGNNNKFSFIKTGDIYNCYHNQMIDGNYELKDQLQSQIMLNVCLRWVLNKVSRKE